MGFEKMSGVIGNMQADGVRSRSYESINTKVRKRFDSKSSVNNKEVEFLFRLWLKKMFIKLFGG